MKMSDQIEKLLPELGITYTREKFRLERLLVNDHLARPDSFQNSRNIISNQGMKTEWNLLLKNLRYVQDWLVKQLESSPKGYWSTQDGKVSLIIDGPIPINQLTFKPSTNSTTPNIIVWDKDGDERLSDEDLSVPFHIKGNRIIIDATWIANRVTKNSHPHTNPFPHGSLISVPTQFNLLIDPPISLISVKAHNALTGKSALLPKEKKQGNSPRHSNRPVFKSPSQAIEVWSSEVEIKKVRVIEHPIRIMPGVKIYMHPSASLIFRNRVFIEGTKLAPVSILPLKSDQTWGTVALHGAQTEGSIINNLNIKD
ncbi:uncharacterized protein METZ01_LOCUS361699, partial [marine metagenome]